MGFNFGAREYGRVKKAIVFTTAVSVVYTLIVWFFIHGFPEFFIRIFDPEGELITAGIPSMQTYYFGYFMKMCIRDRLCPGAPGRRGVERDREAEEVRIYGEIHWRRI